jgi:colanic acid biosynthesis glycosyl transferase WcaI
VRLVVLSQWFPPEGAPIPASIARGLADRGHEVTVLTGFPNYPHGEIFEGWRQRPWLDSDQEGYRIRRVALYPSHDSSAVKRAAGYLSFGVTSTAFGWKALRKADAVYVYHPPLTSAFGPWLSRLTGGAPYVLHVQDLWPDAITASEMVHGRSLTISHGLLDRACGAVYRRAAAIICIAPTMAATLRDRGVRQEKLTVIPNWADEELFFPLSSEPACSSGATEHRTFSVMYAGNLGHVQGLDTAIAAAAKVRDLADFRLVVVGDGIARADLERQARALHAENVVFMGRRPYNEMNTLAHGASVQLVSLRDLPLFRGTIPSKLGAVMASGLPVICAINGDAADIVTEAGAGWACPAGDVEELARIFRLTHATPRETLQRRGAAGRVFYAAQLSRERALNQIEALMRGVARS